MKIRKGFVSNSSSSSFVAWGGYDENIKIPDEFYLKIFDEDLSEEEPELETNGEKIDAVKGRYGSETFEINDISSRNRPYVSECMVGITVYTLMEKYGHLKLEEIPEFVANKINEAFGSNMKKEDIRYFEESWMDN